MHPGPDITVAAAASMAGVPDDDARRLLAELTGAHLATEHVPGRFAFHDLLRAYAAEKAQVQDGSCESCAAMHRALDYYLHAARAADQLINPARDPLAPAPAQQGVLPERFSDAGQALAWLAAEHEVLLAAVRWAAGAQFDRHALQLSGALVTFLDRRGHLDDYVATQQTGLAAAQRLGDLAGQAAAQRDLGGAYGRLGCHDSAHGSLSRALAQYRRLGDRGGQARVHLNLGWLCNLESRHSRGLWHCRHALELLRASQEPIWQARALGQVGWCHTLLGDHVQALAVGRQALDLHREFGDQLGEAAAWESLGDAHRQLSHHQEAVRCFQRSGALYAGLGERYYHAETLTRLGDTCQASGNLPAARDAWRQALTILADHSRADAGQLRARLGRTGSATRAAAGTQ